MTDDDIRKLETALDVVLPTPYREFLRHPPFPEDGVGYEEFYFDNVGDLIDDNHRFRAAKDRNPALRPPDRFLIIGTNLSFAFFVLDLRDPALPVLDVSFGLREVLETYPDFAGWLEQERLGAQEAAEHDAREAARTGWSRTEWLVLAVFILGCLAYIAYKASRYW